MPDFLKITNSDKGTTGRMTISGFLSPWENSAAELTQAINTLAQTCSEIEITLMNCYGGSVFEGIPAYEAIKNSPVPVTTVTEGLVASMGGILFMAGSKRYMGNLSRLMIHRVSGEIAGDVDAIRNYATMMEGLEGDLTDIIASVSGLSNEDVKAKWLQSGIDNYLTAKQAEDANLINGTITGGIKKDVPKNVLKQGVSAVVNYYAEQLENPKTIDNKKNEMSKLTIMAVALGLADSATEEQVLTAINALSLAKREADAKIAKLEGEVQQHNATMVAELVENAVNAKKITAAEKDTYTKLAKADFASTKAVLDAKQAHVSLSNQIRNGQAGSELGKHDGWDYKRFMKEDPQALAKMQMTEPERFKELKAAYVESLKG